MIRKPTLLTIILLCSLAFSTSSISASEWPWEINSLKGIKKIRIVIPPLADSQELNISESFLRTLIELKLRLVGVEITSEFDRDASLSIELNTTYDKQNNQVLYAFNLQISRDVYLEYNNPKSTVANTWGVGPIGGYVEYKSFRANLKTYIEDSMDQFLNDYLKANPR